MDTGEATFTAWARMHQARLVRSAFLLSGSQPQAEDLVQETLIKVAERWSRLEHENPEAYARKVLFNSFVSWRRLKRNSTPAVAASRDLAEPDHSARIVQRESLIAALAHLTKKQRSVLVLRYFEDLSEQQTAEVLGVTVGTVKSHSAAALTRLRSVTTKWEDQDASERI
ncbi:MAG: SigE family RNA polymerase sigma factor [Actinomycetia bacterium]|nr:SigE family RNA polymerase sigma factor [Actinomycetes bacterium]